MKIRVSHDKLNTAVLQVARVFGKSRHYYPVLNHIYIDATHGPNEIRLTATDLKFGIMARIPAYVTEEGTATVPGRTYADLLPLLDPLYVELRTNEERGFVFMECGNTRTTTYHSDPDEYPSVWSRDPENSWQLDLRGLIVALDRTAYAAGNKRGRNNYVYFTHTGNELIIRSSDGVLLAEEIIPCKAEPFSLRVDSAHIKKLTAALRQVNAKTVTMGHVDRRLIVDTRDPDSIELRFIVQGDPDMRDFDSLLPTGEALATISFNLQELKTRLSRVKKEDRATLAPLELRGATLTIDGIEQEISCRWDGVKTPIELPARQLYRAVQKVDRRTAKGRPDQIVVRFYGIYQLMSVNVEGLEHHTFYVAPNIADSKVGR